MEAGSLDQDIFGVTAVLLAVGLLPILAVMLTSFIKVSVVLLILRNALGVQQTPSNIVVYSFAIILSAYIWLPAADTIIADLSDPDRTFDTYEDWQEAYVDAREPIKDFLIKHVRPREQAFFTQSVFQLWPIETAQQTKETDLIILIPAFVISELTRAFEIGFLIYLPFIAIDLIVTGILMALGMMMVSPVIISVPVKLFLFVAADGWSRLAQGLILSYV